MTKMKLRIMVLIVVLGIGTRFAFFGFPKEAVFNEVYFIPFVESYRNGQSFVDVHPPLGKMILSLAPTEDTKNTIPENSVKRIGDKLKVYCLHYQLFW